MHIVNTRVRRGEETMVVVVGGEIHKDKYLLMWFTYYFNAKGGRDLENVHSLQIFEQDHSKEWVPFSLDQWFVKSNTTLKVLHQDGFKILISSRRKVVLTGVKIHRNKGRQCPFRKS